MSIPLQGAHEIVVLELDGRNVFSRNLGIHFQYFSFDLLFDSPSFGEEHLLAVNVNNVSYQKAYSKKPILCLVASNGPKVMYSCIAAKYTASFLGTGISDETTI